MLPECDHEIVQVEVVESAHAWPETQAVLFRSEDSITRLAGDRYVFLEFGDMVLDFAVRAKVAQLQQWLEANAPPGGFLESSPGVRSALLEYDVRKLPLKTFLKLLERCDANRTIGKCTPFTPRVYGAAVNDSKVQPSSHWKKMCRAQAELPDVRRLQVPSRIVHLPMAFGEARSKEAMARYAASVRPQAAYLPDNVPFVAETNGLAGGVAELKRIMFKASYMVFGLGDVYLGAPCAVPVNPLHRCAGRLLAPLRQSTARLANRP